MADFKNKKKILHTFSISILALFFSISSAKSQDKEQDTGYPTKAIQNIRIFDTFNLALDSVFIDSEEHADSVFSGFHKESYGILVKVEKHWEYWPLVFGFWQPYMTSELHSKILGDSKLILFKAKENGGRGSVNGGWSFEKRTLVVVDIELRLILLSAVTSIYSQSYSLDTLKDEEVLETDEGCSLFVEIFGSSIQIGETSGDLDECKCSLPVGEYVYEKDRLFPYKDE